MTLATIDRNPYEPTLHTGNAWIELVKPAANLAQEIAQTEFVPKEFRNKPAAITACILYGAELGLGPMVSLSKIAVIQGKPAPYAELGRALALAAGHEVWVEESTNTRVTVAGKRRGSNHVHSVTWTMDDVRKAGISNHNYTKYPRQMLLARASAELVRAMCPDVLGGIAQFAEEVEAGEEPATVTAIAPPDDGKAKTTRKRRQPAAAETVEPEAALEPVPDQADPAKPSDAQTKMAMASFTEVGIIERDDRMHATGALVGHPVTSWSDVNRDEASRVIDGLERIKAGELSFLVSDDGAWSIPAEEPRGDLFDDDGDTR